MKPFLFFICFIACSGWVAADIGQQDTTRAIAYFEEAGQAFDKNTEQTDSIAFDLYQKGLSIFNRSGYRSKHVATAYMRCGIIKQAAQDLPLAIAFYKKSLETWNILGLQDYHKLGVYRGLVEVFAASDQMDSAFYYFSEGDKMTGLFEGQRYTADLYNTYGYSLFKEGNYSQAINLFRKGIEHMKQSTSRRAPISIISMQNNIAVSFNRLFQFDEAKKAYQEMLPLLEAIPNTEINQAIIKQNIAKSMFQNGAQDSAFYMLDEAEKTYLATGKTIPEINIKLKLKRGMFLLGKGASDEATNALQEALALNNQHLPPKNILKAQILKAMGDVLQEQQAYRNALTRYQEAASALLWEPLSAQESKIILSELDMFHIKQAEAQALKKLSEQTENQEMLATALKSFQEAINLSDKVRKGYSTERSKLFFYQQVYPVYEQSLLAAYSLAGKQPHFQREVFRIAEQSKAAILREYSNASSIKRKAQIPESLIQEEKRIRGAISAKKNKMQKLSDSTQARQNQRAIRDLEVELEVVTRKFEQYPSYRNLKYEHQPLDIEMLHEALAERDQALVEYFMGEEVIFALIVQEDNIVIEKIERDSLTNHAIHDLVKALYEFEAGARYQGDVAAEELYQQLWQPVAKHLSGQEQILMVADGILHQIPFDALVSDLNGPHYLIEDWSIQYAYSAALWLNALDKKYRTSNQVLAFAPFAHERLDNNTQRGSQYISLPASRIEAQTHGKKVFLNETATKSAFLENYQDYDVLHLATHAKALDEASDMSYIAFYPYAFGSSEYRLHVHEMYNLALDSTKLAILSACQTGGGKLVKGEGILSLARGFTFAGCPNIIMTLWEADDKAAASIVSTMQDYLMEGLDKDQALRQAKLDYIDANNRIKNHPVFWANFVFFGENQPIVAYKPYSTDSTAFMFFLGTLAAAFITALILFKRHKSMSSPTF